MANKMKRLIVQSVDAIGLKYALYGFALVIFGYALYVLFLALMPSTDYYLAANLLAYLFHLTTSYAVHSKLVFHTKMTIPGITAYFTSSIANISLGSLLLFALVDQLDVNPYLANPLTVMILVPVFYLVNRFFIFR